MAAALAQQQQSNLQKLQFVSALHQNLDDMYGSAAKIAAELKKKGRPVSLAAGPINQLASAASETAMKAMRDGLIAPD